MCLFIICNKMILASALSIAMYFLYMSSNGATFSVDTNSVEVAPVKKTPLEKTPMEKTPLEKKPMMTTPVGTMPMVTTPVGTTPMVTTAVGTTPVEATSVKTTPTDLPDGGLPEGSTCVTKNITGTCVKMHKCSILIVDLMHPYLNKTYPEICSYDGDTPIVCCTSCKDDLKVNNISDAVYAPSGVLFMKTGRKHWDKCLEYSQYASYYPRCRKKGGVLKGWYKKKQCHFLNRWWYFSIGGIPAKRDMYTHMALLGFGYDLTQVEWLCGGSLISEKFILTAGHCTRRNDVGPVAYAALGILKRSDPEELWQKYSISRVITHPQYRPPSKYHDIALLETDRPVKFSRAVFPACLMSFDDPTVESSFSKVTATGWGALGHQQPLADTLQVIKVQKFNVKSCEYYYPAYRLLQEGYNATTQMCYGDHWRSVDTCLGDSGGPLQIEISDLCMFVVIGVTSFGRSCGIAGQPGMYTRVHHYVPWIERHVWPED